MEASEEDRADGGGTADVERPGRRGSLRLADLMAAVAMVAVAMALPSTASLWADLPLAWGRAGQRFVTLLLFEGGFWAAAVGSALAVLHRRRLGWAARSYGAAAAFAGGAGVAFVFIDSLALTLVAGRVNPRSALFPRSPSAEVLLRFLSQLPPGAACAVAGAWLILALTGEGRRPSGWLEWLGLGLGLFWVVWLFGRVFLAFFL